MLNVGAMPDITHLNGAFFVGEWCLSHQVPSVFFVYGIFGFVLLDVRIRRSSAYAPDR